MTTFVWLQIFGFMYLGMGLAMSLNPSAFKGFMDELPHNKAAMFCISFMTLLIGSAVVATHSAYSTTPQVIVSLIGWATLIKGLVYMVNPFFIERFKPWIQNSGTIKTMGFFCTILGAIILAISTTWL